MAGSLVSRRLVCPWPGGRCAEAKSQRVMSDREEGCFELGDERVCAGLLECGVTVLCTGHNLATAVSAAQDCQAHPVSSSASPSQTVSLAWVSILLLYFLFLFLKICFFIFYIFYFSFWLDIQ